MRCKNVYLSAALVLIFILLCAILVYALTSVVYNDQVDFDSGVYNNTGYFGNYLGVNITLVSPFEPNQSESGLINMSGNQLLAYFDETAADTLSASEDIEDFSSNGFNGEDYGTVNYGSNGLFLNAIDLTSGAGAIDFGDIEMGSWGQITVSIWVNRTGGSGSQRIVSKDRLGTPGNFIFYFDDNVLTLRFRDGNSWETLTYSPTLGGIDGEWHQTGFSVDESTNTIYLYWDGQIVDTVGSFGAATLDDTDNEEVVVGADSNVGSFGDYFTGYVDDLAIWDRALSSEEIEAIYTSIDSSGVVVTYTSAVENSGSSTDWQSLSWYQDYCFLCALPDNSSNETSSWFNFPVDMDQTIFLYHFDEVVLNSTADNQDFYDSSGNYLHANESGDLTLVQEGGLFGGAVNFSSDLNGIEIGYLNFSNISDLTMSVWFNTDVSSGIQRIFSKDAFGTPGAFIQNFDGSNSEFRVYDTSIGNWREITFGAGDFLDGRWHHRVDVIDTQNDLIFTYIDGVEMGNQTFSADFLDDSDEESLTLGVDSDLMSNSYEGLLDEAVMWARAFSSDEVAALYYRGYDSSINFSVRSCNDAACSGESYTSFSGNSPIDISSLADNQYIQFQSFLKSIEDGFYLGPQLYNVTLTDQFLSSDIQTSGNSWELSEGSRQPSEDPGAAPPTAILLDSPVNGTSGTDRSFEFIWNNSATANVTYDFQLSTDYNFGSTVISASGLSEENSSQTNYSTTDDLPVDDVYYWRVRAVNGITPGDWSEVWEVEVLSYLAISLLATTGVDFGNLIPGQSEDTETTSGLQPIIIRNDGNYPVNITVNASSFFVNSGGAYQFKIEDNETGSYDFAFTTYTDLNSSLQQAVTNLNYENSSNTGNTVNMHLTITVPSLEPAADKTSFIEISTG